MGDFLATIGRSALDFFASVGRLFLFAGVALSHIVRPPFYLRLLLKQMMLIGYNSLPVVGLTSLFTGMVLALQSHTGFAEFGGDTAVALLVVLSVTRELGPVIAGLMVAGRVGAAIAAELGTMSVTDQIAALSTLSTNPFKYLVVPRILAGIITMPMLVVVADVIGILGGYVVAVYLLGANPSGYLHETWIALKFPDFMSGLYKAAMFGFVVTLMGCYHGYHSRGGAQGVGSATTNAVVSSSILILLMDYLMTSVFFS